MRAFVLNEAGGTPVIQDFEEPDVQADGQEVFEVLGAALNPYDRFLAQTAKPLPRVVGIEAVGKLANGERMYVGQTVLPFGTVAERSVGPLDQMFLLPNALDVGAALSIGISGLAGWLPLEWKAQVQPGESVLILGATGIQGQIAVQAAKLLGAGHVVAAGRDQAVLETLRSKGADEIVVLEHDSAEALKVAAPEGGYDVVIDSLFGLPFQSMLDSGTLGPDSRVVVVGGSAGQQASLEFRQLQAAQGATIAGYSSFYVPLDVRREAYMQMAQHLLSGELLVDVQSFPLEQAGDAWEAQVSGPHRKIIVTP